MEDFFINSLLETVENYNSHIGKRMGYDKLGFEKRGRLVLY